MICFSQDEFAMRSHANAKAAQEAGNLSDVVPLMVNTELEA